MWNATFVKALETLGSRNILDKSQNSSKTELLIKLADKPLDTIQSAFSELPDFEHYKKVFIVSFLEPYIKRRFPVKTEPSGNPKQLNILSLSH